MRLKIQHILFAFLLFALGGSLYAQSNYSISQFNQHKPLINPATIASNAEVNGAMLFRKQWVGIKGSPTTSIFDVNLPVRASNNHLGLSVLADYYGINQNINVSLTYAYKAKLNRNEFLSFALSPSLEMIQADYTLLNLDYENDVTYTNADPNGMAPNLRFGAYYQTKYYYLGVSSPALFTNNFGINGTGTTFKMSNVQYNIMAGYNREFNSKWDLQYAALVKQTPGSPVQADLLFQTQYFDKYGAGVSYSTSQTISFMFNMLINPNFRLAYSYGYTFSQLRALTSGNQEIMLVFGIWNKKRSYINMPKLLEQYQNDHKDDVGTEIKKPVKDPGKQPYSGGGN
jgi:type IX secretion system PorP/SprF family membrane protein